MDSFDNERFVLYLSVTTTDDVRTPLWFRSSPRAITDRFVGEKSGLRAPDRCRALEIGEPVSFAYPRCGISDLFATLALSQHNRDEGLSVQLLRWSEGASLIAQARRQIFYRFGELTTPPRPRLVTTSNARAIQNSLLDRKRSGILSRLSKPVRGPKRDTSSAILVGLVSVPIRCPHSPSSNLPKSRHEVK
ncbi:hypothetical protein HGRIS_011181 [Hohenbuehelia grisea]|uniref:Uncharacterized protein n=1 Tax=Hohenbuehelia grisea TaxID=104357 RepID=A0ABR3JWI9_9AGAR